MGSNFGGKVLVCEALISHYKIIYKFCSVCPTKYKEIPIIQSDYGLICIIAALTDFSSGTQLFTIQRKYILLLADKYCPCD